MKKALFPPCGSTGEHREVHLTRARAPNKPTSEVAPSTRLARTSSFLRLERFIRVPVKSRS